MAGTPWSISIQPLDRSFSAPTTRSAYAVSFVYRWDLHFMLTAVGWRETVLILLSLGRLGLSLSGIVIAGRYVGISVSAIGQKQTSGPTQCRATHILKVSTPYTRVSGRWVEVATEKSASIC